MLLYSDGITILGLLSLCYSDVNEKKVGELGETSFESDGREAMADNNITSRDMQVSGLFL